MLAVTSHGPKDIRVDEVAKPGLQDKSDAIVRVTTSALCGTDLHIYHGKIPNVPDGWIIGHEFCGVIEDVGDAITEFEIGDRVVSAMYVACGRCPACVGGDHRRCPQFKMFGMGASWGNLPGGQAEYVRVPLADMVLRSIPDNLSDESTIFTGDILATAFSALRQSGIVEGDTIAIVGAGPLGQLIAMCAPIFGAGLVFVIDVVEERLEEAAQFGAIPINSLEQSPRKLIKEATNGLMCDAIFEAAGNEKAMETAFSLPRPNGAVVLVGILVDEHFPLSAGDLWLRNTKVIPVLGAPYSHRDELLRLIANGKIDAAQLITDRLPITDAPDAYAAFDRKELQKAIFQVSA
jgi:2-desacetyl-2-hydroxyethyl bacteriochlorophyllide A dehydrogenase